MQKEQKSIIWILLWCVFVGLIANTVRMYHLGDFPPLWDNLVYQINGLEIARAFLESRWSVFNSMMGENIPVGYGVFLALSFLVFGFHTVSPYIVSAMFGVACLAVCYSLTIKLGARRNIALVGVLFLSILPNFIYQNFLQTRNDFPLAFFISLAWLLFLQALERQNYRRAFISGLVAGCGTLFKLSAPGYIIWWVCIILVLPLSWTKTSFTTKLKHLIFFALGATLSCGWFYLPALPKILKYYQLWSKMGQWQSVQYSLHASSDRMLFYLKNLVIVHLTPPFAIVFIYYLFRVCWLSFCIIK